MKAKWWPKAKPNNKGLQTKPSIGFIDLRAVWRSGSLNFVVIVDPELFILWTINRFAMKALDPSSLSQWCVLQR